MAMCVANRATSRACSRGPPLNARAAMLTAASGLQSQSCRSGIFQPDRHVKAVTTRRLFRAPVSIMPASRQVPVQPVITVALPKVSPACISRRLPPAIPATRQVPGHLPALITDLSRRAVAPVVTTAKQPRASRVRIFRLPLCVTAAIKPARGLRQPSAIAASPPAPARPATTARLP